MTFASDNQATEADHPLEIERSGWIEVFKRVRMQFAEDHVTLAAAGVAFFGFLALVPALIAAVSIYGLIADPSSISRLVQQVGSVAPPAVADLIDQQLRSIVESSNATLTTGLVVSVLTSLWTASGATGHLIEAINIAYDRDIDSRPWWRRRGLAVLFTVGFLMWAAATAAIIVLVRRLATEVIGVLLGIAGWGFAASMLVVALAILYRRGPDRTPARWKWISPGAVLAVIGWVVISAGFRIYVTNFGSYNEIYGSLGAVVVVLLWFYLSSLVIIIGAEFNAEIERQTTSNTTIGSDELASAGDDRVADEATPSTR